MPRFCRRAFSTRTRHGLLAWRRFRRECGLERRTADRGTLCCQSKEDSLGSKVVFRDAECLAVDTGPDVVNRKAARLCGRNQSEHNAIVIDRFFDAREKALAWTKANPHFMVVRVRTPDTEAAY